MIILKTEKEPKIKFFDFGAFQKMHIICNICHHVENITFTCFLGHFIIHPVYDLDKIQVSWRYLWKQTSKVGGPGACKWTATCSKRPFNSYWQILENSSRNFSEISVFRGVTQTDFWKTDPVFFRDFNFQSMSWTDFWKIHPSSFCE